jgi:asparagine synthase (glutamine-hydrolysing)
MCGIAGFIAGRAQGAPRQIDDIARSMSESLRHRGPDGDGVWIDPEAGIGLIHRRLSIVDLSPGGHQPLVSAVGGYVIS